MEKVGNEKQFKFNQSVEARFDSAISAIEKKKLDKAKKELEEGKKLLFDRQKFIQLAERSECGWATVSACVTDDLADTPEGVVLLLFWTTVLAGAPIALVAWFIVVYVGLIWTLRVSL